MTKRADSHDTTLSVRLSNELLERLEDERHALQAAHPGITITTSDVVRSKIVRGLDCRDD